MCKILFERLTIVTQYTLLCTIKILKFSGPGTLFCRVTVVFVELSLNVDGRCL